jgi:uncharacterized membrane protein
MSGTTLSLLTSVFLASAVEFVEAFTIVLAMGVTRGWRSALLGAGAAVVVLVVVTGVLGYGLRSWVSESLLQLVVGVLLLVFGLQWLRKAVLRSAGVKALNDEVAEFREQQERARLAERTTYAGVDLFGFLVSFKGVLLEGVEVVFIVLTFGLSAGALGLAVAGAAAAAVLVLGAGLLLREPLARVPENTLKYAVAILLTSFGTFWTVEGAGHAAPGGTSLAWPGDRISLLVLVAVWLTVSQVVVRVLSVPRPDRVRT